MKNVMTRRQALDRAVELKQVCPRTVFMMCGVAGAGKTTFAKELAAYGCERLSIDEEIWTRNGLYGIDYPAEDYERLSCEAEANLRRRLELFLGAGVCAILDFSFWSARARQSYRELIEHHEHLWQLIYFDVNADELKRRLRRRSESRDANAAFVITDELLETYLNGFEIPKDPVAWVVRDSSE